MQRKMDPLRLNALLARVVAWHNRHPLARRISAAQVNSVGYVAIPFIGPAPEAGAAPPQGADSPAASLRERLLARGPDATPALPGPAGAGGAVGAAGPTAPANTQAPHFSEDFISPLRPRAVARWAAQHALALPQPPADAPVRTVPADATKPNTVLTLRYALTASVEVGARRSRVLLPLDGDGDGALLGRRLPSPMRAGGLAFGLLLAPALAATAWTLASRADVAPGVATTPATPAPVVASIPAATTAEVLPTSALAAPAAPAAAPPTAAASVAAPSTAAAPVVPDRPVDVEPRLGRIALPAIAGVDAAERSAARERRLAAPASLPTPASLSAAPTPAAQATDLPPTLPTGTAWAVSTRMLRTRTEAQQIRDAMQALLAAGPHAPPRVELLAQGEDWRVVGWPYADRAQADAALAQLAARGMRVQVLQF